jgi:hypothetical protein
LIYISKNDEVNIFCQRPETTTAKNSQRAK